MLELKSIKLINNLLLIKENPVEVQTTTPNGIRLPEEKISRARAAVRFRTGVIVAHGKLTADETADLTGKVVMYPADRIDGLDIPVCLDKSEENPTRIEPLVMLDLHTVFAFIEE